MGGGRGDLEACGAKVRPGGAAATQRKRRNHIKSVAASSARFVGAVVETFCGPPLTRRSLTRPFPLVISCGRNRPPDASRRRFGGLPDEKTDLFRRRPDRVSGT